MDNSNSCRDILSSRESLWTLREVALFLQVSEDSVMSWVEDGRLPYLDIFGELRFEPAEVVAAIHPPDDEIRHSVSESVQLISLKNLCSAVGLHRTTIYRKVRAGQFPRPVQLGSRRRAWRLVDVQKWIANHVQP